MFKIAYGRFIDFVFQKETMINIFLNKRFLFIFFFGSNTKSCFPRLRSCKYNCNKIFFGYCKMKGYKIVTMCSK